MNETPQVSHRKRTVTVIAVIATLVVVGAIVAFLVVNVRNKAVAAADSYEAALVSYVEKLQKGGSVDLLKTEVQQPPRLEKVTFGEYTKEYRTAQSREIIEGIYHKRLAAAAKHYDDTSFDRAFRELDAIKNGSARRESDARRAAEGKAEATRDALQNDLRALIDRDISNTSKEYLAKEAAIRQAELAGEIDALVAEYSLRETVETEYRQKLDKLPAHEFAERYKTGMLRAIDKQLAVIKEFIGKVKQAKTPGEAQRLEHQYMRLKYENAKQEYYEGRWASEEILYVNPFGPLDYALGAMKYAATTDTMPPRNEEEARIYAEALYSGHLAAAIVSADTDGLSRTDQAKVRFGLTELRDSVTASGIDQKLKDKYFELIDAAYETVRVMPGAEAYNDTSAARRLQDLVTFVNYLENYVGVSLGASVSDSDVSEKLMRHEAAGIRGYYVTAKEAILPKTAHGKAERDAFTKQLDKCMDFRFAYYDQRITDTVALEKLKGGLDEYISESDKLNVTRDKLVKQYDACYDELDPLYPAAEEQANSYEGHQKLLVKQLTALR